MKKLMMMMAVTASAFGVWAAQAKSLVASAELAPMAELTPMVTALGTAMNNPLLPAIALGGAQQMLQQNYGRLRNELPLRWQLYVATDELATIKLGDKDPFKGKSGVVLLYPMADNEATLLQKNAKATKGADGTIRLPAGGARKETCWAKFTADGKYCAFAPTAALAEQAVADFTKRPAPKANKKAHLLRVGVREAGLTALATLVQKVQAEQKGELLKLEKSGNKVLADKVAAFSQATSDEQMKLLKTFAGGMLALDLDDNGISIVGGLRRKPGVQVDQAGVTLPVGAFDGMPMGPNFFLACNRLARFASNFANQEGYARQKALLHDLLQSVPALIDAEAAKNKDLQKYSALIKEVVLACDETLLAFAYPQKADWDSLAVGFDAQKRPAVLGGGDVTAAQSELVVVKKFLARLAAAFTRQWPGSQFLVQKDPSTFVVNWGAIIDYVAAETGTNKRPDQVKDIVQFKKTLTGVLGGLTSEITLAAHGQRADFASPGVKVPSAAAGVGEARFLAAVPEAAKARPGAAFYFTPYAFVRDIVLPQVAKFGDKETVQQVQPLLTALPPAEAKGALAGASWYRQDGSIRFLLRLTGDEVKSIGAAVGAVSAAAATDDDDDDDN